MYTNQELPLKCAIDFKVISVNSRMLLVETLCLILSLCDLTQQATKVVRIKRLIYTVYPTRDGGRHSDYSVDKGTDKGNEGYDNNGDNGHEGYHGYEEYHGQVDYNGHEGYNGYAGQAANEEHHVHGGYNGFIEKNALEENSDNNGHNDNRQHISNLGYDLSDNYNPEAHNEVYDPNGHAIAILYAGPHTHDGNLDSGNMLNPYGTLQNNWMTDLNAGQPNPWEEHTLTGNKDVYANPSGSILGPDAQVEITGVSHKVRLPDFGIDSTNPHTKLEAVMQHLKNRQNGDHANDVGKENNDNMVMFDKHNLDADSYDKNNQNYQKSDYGSEDPIGKVNIHFGKVNKLNIQMGDGNDDKKEKIPSYSREENRDRYVNKNMKMLSHSREEDSNNDGNKNERVSSSYREDNVSAYGRVYDDNSKSKESRKVSKDEKTNLDENVQEGSSSEEEGNADDDESDEEDGS